MPVPRPPTLDEPWYGIPFREAVRRFWRKYRTFGGRASRSEFWWWQLVTGLVTLLFELILLPVVFATSFGRMQEITPSRDPFGGGVVHVYVQEFHAVFTPPVIVLYVVFGVYGLVTLLPNLALWSRRLHDTDRSAWWLLLLLVPYASIVLIVFAILDTKPAGARFDTVHSARRSPQG